MSRIKLNAPGHFPFSTYVPIRITDINYGGHVGNDTILSIIHEARMQFLQHHELSEMQFGKAALIMSDVSIEFKKELFYNDRVQVFVTATELGRVGFDLFYKLVKNGDEIIALAKTGMICYDYNSKKIVSLPENIKEQFQKS